MKNFEAHWQTLAGKARQAAGRDESAPFGFATRVLAQSRFPADSVREDIWGRLIVRFLGVAVPVLVLCAALEGPHLRRAPSLESGVENTVAEILWRL